MNTLVSKTTTVRVLDFFVRGGAFVTILAA